MTWSSWLAQFHSISHGLLFAHGHVADVRTAAALRTAAEPPVDESAGQSKPGRAAGTVPAPVTARQVTGAACS